MLFERPIQKLSVIYVTTFWIWHTINLTKSTCVLQLYLTPLHVELNVSLYTDLCLFNNRRGSGAAGGFVHEARSALYELTAEHKL